MATSYCKIFIMQCFCIFTNSLNYSDCGNILPAHTIYMTLFTEVVSDGNKVSNGLGF